ncbi:MAG: HNH endonuclease signature motif containing protein [Luteolibacter sp.]
MPSDRKKPLAVIHREILELLRNHPDGLDIEQIRDFGKIEGQQHLDKRVRDLYPFFEISTSRHGKRYVYKLIRERHKEDYDYSTISKTLRAKVLHRDGRRCRMCGKTVDEDNIKLHLDHKIPREWGGLTNEENLWALCSGCNEGKRNYFSSFDSELMESILTHDSVHRRLAEMLHAKSGQWVDCDLLEFVANFEDYQTDWRKRLRELRYFGLDIETKNTKVEKRTLSNYRLNNWVELPRDLSDAARRFEVERAKENKKRKQSDS